MIYVNHNGVDKLVAGGEGDVLVPGAPLGGGFFVGTVFIQGTVYARIVSDKSAEVQLRWKTSNTITSGANSNSDGWENTNAINNDLHPAARYCREYRGGGFDDWYLGAQLEMQALGGLAPGNATTQALYPGLFSLDGSQQVEWGSPYWLSQNSGTGNARTMRYEQSGSPAYEESAKTTILLVRPLRKILLTPQ